MLRNLLLLIMFVVAASASVASASFMRAPEIPVERLLANTAAYVKENPKNPQGYYLLGRINALAFAIKSGKLRAFHRNPKALVRLDPYQGRPSKTPPLKTEQLTKHVIDSITNFRKAIALKPDSGLYRLGLAYILEQGSQTAYTIGAPPGEKPHPAANDTQAAQWKGLIEQLGNKDSKARDKAQNILAAQMPAVAKGLMAFADDKNVERQARVRKLLAGYWNEQAIREYLLAHNLAIKTDSKIKHRPLRGLMSLASYESGKAYIRLVEKRGATKAETKIIEKVKQALKELSDKPRGPITPIIFSLDTATAPRDLLSDGTVVRFDLDGDGLAQNWPWVKPSTGILVWDPSGKGRITSGRQLFGSVTFWMFFNDGFHALNVLDDDRDGRLSGSELRGLAVWFDRNSNGRSDRGEVTDITRLGIEAIETRASHKATPSGWPAHHSGLKMKDGTTRPLYDWIPSPLPRNVKQNDK
ncbi:MAG: hypothetical protein GY794_16035 [bacterium]|nr:hypothetical protein [bacterium]